MSELNIEQTGKGNTIILIHGFPMNSTVWDSFSLGLSKDFRVVTIDLPGFGKSPALKKYPFSIDDVAEAMLELLADKKIKNSVLIGHSLGGYVALSMVKKMPELFSGLGLFHSTAYADSAEKKQSRTKVLDFIDNNGVETFTTNFIAPLFADQNHHAIEKIREIARASSTEAVKGFTIAMRDREDLTDVIKNFIKPILFIAGEKDGGIPADTVVKQSTLSTHSEVHVLEGVAHMGMFENPLETTRIIGLFSTKCFN
jgi:pimeloyl-ACP methyl ester carboxylesterase